ncbi:hypothetical protein C7B61_13600 [filamentous cyanobacterium CCP1]|nr:hypothetical protein C7B76_07415 [filamentous cyanobacterium CCP2]PSB63210.1 hypothetical protein C7B61_13600 [filamentous cyanobacterium CCP1]
MNRCWLALAIVLGTVGHAIEVVARPAEVFLPHLEQIRLSIPPDDVLRLPSEILLGGPGGLNPNELIVKVFPSSAPARLTISLFTCESSPFPCLVGSFTAESAGSANAQRELARHQAMDTPITLAQGVRGYLQEGPSLNPPSDFSSVMWEQEGMIYSVSFLASERQNILFMARSMAIQPPIFSMQVPPVRSTPPSTEPSMGVSTEPSAGDRLTR